jgi:uncharacterized protein YjiS (DUF1127 family)
MNFKPFNFTNPLPKWIAGYKRRAAAKQAMRELNSLSNRELNDIGISRGDIYSVIHGSEDMIRTNENMRGWV